LCGRLTPGALEGRGISVLYGRGGSNVTAYGIGGLVVASRGASGQHCNFAKSANVLSPLMAFTATLTLNVGKWFLRGLLLMVLLLSRVLGLG
jgi:hypothetical protein